MVRIELQAGSHGGHAEGRECREAPEDPICGISLRKPFQWMPIRGIVAMGRRGSATSPAIVLAPCSFVPSVVKRVSPFESFDYREDKRFFI